MRLSVKPLFWGDCKRYGAAGRDGPLLFRPAGLTGRVLAGPTNLGAGASCGAGADYFSCGIYRHLNFDDCLMTELDIGFGAPQETTPVHCAGHSDSALSPSGGIELTLHASVGSPEFIGDCGGGPFLLLLSFWRSLLDG